MSKEITLAIELQDSDMADSIWPMTRDLPGVRSVRWHHSMGEKGDSSVMENPEIFLIDDKPAAGVYRRISRLKDNFPRAHVVVVSPEQSPGHIVEVMKAGAAEYLVYPFGPGDFRKAVEDVQARVDRGEETARSAVYSFISSKGGLGATTLAVNAATGAAMRKNGPVVLCDMSFESGDGSVLLDLLPETSLSDISRNFHRLDLSFLNGSIKKHKSGLDLLASPVRPEESEEIRPEHISGILDLLQTRYAQIFVDCTSMHIDDRTVEIFETSGRIFIVLDLSVPAIRNAARVAELVRKIGIHPHKLEFVINRFTKKSALSLEEAEKSLGKRVYWLFPNDFDEVITSINRGIPLVHFHPGSSFARNVMAFLEKLRNPDTGSGFRGVKGAFGQII